MTIHVNIGEGQTRLSGTCRSGCAGKEVILDKAGVPQSRSGTSLSSEALICWLNGPRVAAPYLAARGKFTGRN